MSKYWIAVDLHTGVQGMGVWVSGCWHICFGLLASALSSVCVCSREGASVSTFAEKGN